MRCQDPGIRSSGEASRVTILPQLARRGQLLARVGCTDVSAVAAAFTSGNMLKQRGDELEQMLSAALGSFLTCQGAAQRAQAHADEQAMLFKPV